MTKEELKQWRIESALTREEMAEQIAEALDEPFSYRNIENWEQGRRKIPAWVRTILIKIDETPMFE